jgi:hypothetical protein
LAICLESLVKFHNALGNVPVDGQGKEDVLGNSLTDKPWRILETEASVILRMSHKAASSTTQRLQA